MDRNLITPSPPPRVHFEDAGSELPYIQPPSPEPVFRELTVHKPGRPASPERSWADEAASDKYRVRFDRGSTIFPLAGLFLTYATGITFICVGGYLRSNNGIAQDDLIFGDDGILYSQITSTARSFINFALLCLVVLCTESVGHIHSVTQRWALAQEGKLGFCSNPRLFRAAGRWWSPHGEFANALHFIGLLLSYTTASMIYLPIFMPTHAGYIFPGKSTASYIPPIILGSSLLLQAGLASAAFSETKVPTWSNNCFDITAACISHGFIIRMPSRCMRSVRDDNNLDDRHPVYTMPRQISMYALYKDVQRVVRCIWILIPLCILWGGIVAICTKFLPRSGINAVIGTLDWSFFTNVGGRQYTSGTLALALGWPFDDMSKKTLPGGSLAAFILFLAILQAWLVLALSCADYLVDLARDEMTWRRASATKGAPLPANPIVLTVTHWRSVCLIVVKPILLWLFGNATGVLAGYGMYMAPAQILYLFIAGIIFVVGTTLIAFHKPRGEQPAAYGHIQTLANLVDNWTRSLDGRIFWGHKTADRKSGICHAGTNPYPLKQVHPDFPYA